MVECTLKTHYSTFIDYPASRQGSDLCELHRDSRAYKTLRQRDVPFSDLKSKILELPPLDPTKVCNFSDVRIAHGYPELAMSHVAEGNMSDYMAQTEEVDKMRLAIYIACAVQYIHSQGVYHGNFHPGNVLIDASGQPIIGDIQLRYWLTQLNIVPSGRIQEHVRYLSPEALKEGEGFKPTASADVYSLASIIYEVLSGKRPFSQCRNDYAAVIKVVQGEHAAIRRPGSISDGVWTMLQGCWNSDPAKRPPIDEVVERLRDASF